jgi:hypothetical protein
MLSALEQRITGDIASLHNALVKDLASWVAIPSGRGHKPALDEMRGMLVGRLVKLGAVPAETPGAPAPAWLRERESAHSTLRPHRHSPRSGGFVSHAHDLI